MAWQELVVKLLEIVVSWPVVVVVGLVLLRKPLRSVVERLTRIEAFGVTGDFGQRLAQLEEHVDELEAPSHNGEDVTAQRQSGTSIDDLSGYEGLLRIVQAMPELGVVKAWMDVERAIDMLYQQLEPEDRRPKPIYVKIRSLVSAGVLPDRVVKPLDELRTLRNQVAHGLHKPNVGEALTYAQRAEEVTRLLAAAGSLES
ncbi:DUF4145 domain-containing protein [Nocardia sp. NPDC049220]|uniref:DUF4145 domain-containing protein n=1 Tax=Nocardia sp. NPDC049220 TaxID=3155273 RepID=UPI0033EA2731